VLRVIELYVEAFFENRGKRFERRRRAFHIHMTDRTERHGRRYELRQMATGTG
jgi:hypothetical protein